MDVMTGLRPRIWTVVDPLEFDVEASTVSGDCVALAVYSPEELMEP